ncbi:hypothetical protein DFJ73DRAFT_828530 [Zopfochytrium polystomum]|nr:hypothetical protein DFJ73DRAFT_828530 [Zopfochytrium polystomum]
MSIDARLPDGVAKPLFGKLSLDSRSGSVRAGGFDASALRLSSTSGSIKASTVRTQQTIVVARSGSVSLENLVSDTISATTSSGSIAAKNLTISRLAQLSANSGSLRVDGLFGTFHDFSATTTSGSVRINDFHVNHTLPASILTKTGSGSTRMQVYDFRGELLVKSNSGTVVVTGDDLIVERLKREVRGTRVGEKQIHRLQSSTGSGSATVSFL